MSAVRLASCLSRFQRQGRGDASAVTPWGRDFSNASFGSQGTAFLCLSWDAQVGNQKCSRSLVEDLSLSMAEASCDCRALPHTKRGSSKAGSPLWVIRAHVL